MTNVISIRNKEKLTLMYLLGAIFALIVLDISIDFFSGTPMSMMMMVILLEGAILSFVLYSVYFVWVKLERERSSKDVIQKDLILTQKSAQEWKNKSKNYVLEFQKLLREQLELWNLSKSEKEIAILLIKGKTSKEIATLRNTSERTIRNQCQSIYEKSTLNGRHELASYFFNELLENIEVL